MAAPEAVTRARRWIPLPRGSGYPGLELQIMTDLLSAYDALAEDYALVEFAEGLTHQSCIVESHPDWYVNAEHTFICPWCTKDRWAASVREREAAAWDAAVAAMRYEDGTPVEVVATRNPYREGKTDG